MKSPVLALLAALATASPCLAAQGEKGPAAEAPPAKSATITAECPKCHTSYTMPRSKLGNKPVKVRCKLCREPIAVDPTR